MDLLAPIQRLGAWTLRALRLLVETFALLYGALAVLAYVRTRGLRVVFEVGISQTLFTGVHALPLVSLATLAMGTLIITQANTYLPADYVASVATRIITLEVVPLIVAVILLGRSGTAICVELANMKLTGQLDALRSMGLCLEHVVVLPRLVAGIISAAALTVYGLAVGIGGGYALGRAVGSLPFSLQVLVNTMEEGALVEAMVKSVLFGAGIVLVSIREGFSVQASTREVPIAATRAVVNSIAIIVVLNSIISIFF